MEGFEVHGYVQCRCGEFIADTPSKPAPALCSTCRAEAAAKAREAQLSYEVAGERFRTPAPARKKPKKRKEPSGDKLDRKRRADRAKTRAYIRLAAIYRPMFDIIYAEEKLKEGLNPVTAPKIHRATRGDADELLADLADAEARAERLSGDEQTTP